ncbi:MAG TPA: virulence factor [Gaiellales bacterium]
MARYRILTWGGIPAQIKVYGDSGRPRSLELPGWFMQEIDRVATRENIVGADEYLERWQWSSDIERDGGADEVATAVIAELSATWMPPQRSVSEGAS